MTYYSLTYFPTGQRFEVQSSATTLTDFLTEAATAQGYLNVEGDKVYMKAIINLCTVEISSDQSDPGTEL